MSIFITTPDLFVQSKGNFLCDHAKFMRDLSEKKGYRCKCRNARCSFECRCNWAQKQSAVVLEYLDTLGKGQSFYSGCLLMPDHASQDDHDEAMAKFSREIRKAEKDHSIRIRFRNPVHPTAPTEKHYDVLLRTDCPNNLLIQEIFHMAKKKAGFKHGSLKRCHNKADKIDKIDYAFKTGQMPEKGEEYMYLLAKDRSKAVWTNGNFFEGTTVDALWLSVCNKWKSPSKAVNISTEPPSSFPHPASPLRTTGSLTARLEAILPSRPMDSATAECLGWLLGEHRGVIIRNLSNIHGIVEQNGKYHRPRPDEDNIPWRKRLFPDGRIPYHCEHFPLKPDQQTVIDQTCDDYDTQLAKFPMTDEEFDDFSQQKGKIWED